MRTLYAILILLIPTCVNAQYFHYLHTFDTTAEYNRNILLRPDGKLLVAGGYLGLSDYHEDACWYEISQSGDSILNKHSIHTDAHAYYIDYSGNVTQIDNGGYVVPYTLHYYPNDPDRWFNIATLVFLDSQLDTIAVKRYTDTSLYSEIFYDCAMIYDGSYIVGGERISSFVSQQTHTKGLLSRIDQAGNIVWQQTYEREVNKFCRMQSVQPLDSARSLIGGTSMDLVPVGTSSYYRKKPWFVIINNADGTILKDTLFTTGYAQAGIIYKDQNGGYYHNGKKDSLATQNVNDLENFPAYLAHLDTNFNVEWCATFPYSMQPYMKEIWRPRQLLNGDFLICGSGLGTSYYMQGWVARVSSAGAILWSKYYYSQGNKNAYLTDFVERPDGNMILCGWTSNDTVAAWHGQELWLLGLYASGEVLTGTAFTGNASVRTMEFSIYPNPASGSFYLEVPEPGEAELYDMSGKQVATYTVPTKGKTQLLLDNKIAAGNYLLQFTGSESGMVAGKQLIKN